jgi:glucan-binding YG repeat protein
MKKNGFRFALCLVAVITALCLFVLPGKAEAATESGTCGESLTWTLNEEGTLKISGTGAMTAWNSTGSDAPWYGKNVTAIIIGGKVTSVSDYAFYDCDSLTEVSFGISTAKDENDSTVDFDSLIGAITSNKPVTIGSKAFFDCDNLTRVSIPTRVTAIGEGAFAACSNLTNIWVDADHAAYASDANGVLYNKDMTQLLQAPGAFSGTYTIAEGVTTVGKYAFNGCTSMSAVIVGMDVTDIEDSAFGSCGDLTDVYYAGTPSQWTQIQIAAGNEDLKEAQLRYLHAHTGWFSEGGKWYYYDNGVMRTGWIKDGGYWYYMNKNGIMQTGWLKLGSTWYYLKPSGNMATGWAQVGGFWYYFDSNGYMKTGWLQVGGIWYYLKPAGNMATGWCQVGRTWYYFKSSGVMQTGWLKLGNTWYYFHSSGAMATGSVKIGAKTYRFNASGACLNP